jgi:Flp pilus assembly protein TadG
VGREVDREHGSAVVDFALVGSLLTFLFVALIQLALILHVRNVVIDCAVEGARYGALADRDPAAGAARAQALIRAELNDRYAENVTGRAVTVGGLELVEVDVRAPLPVAGLVGFGRSVHVAGHALSERS